MQAAGLPPLPKDRCAWALGGAYLLLVLILCPLAAPPLDVHDEGGKYVFLPSVFFDGDLDFVNQRKGYSLALRVTPTGYSHHQWGIGPALLWSPFFLGGHVLARMAGTVPLDGYGFPYLLGVSIGTLCYGWAGLLLLYDLLRRMYGRAVGALAAGLTFFASPVPFYVFARPIHDHGLTFAAVSLVLWSYYRLKDDPGRIPSWALLGAATGLAMTVRPDTPLVLFSVLAASLPLLRRAPSWKEPALLLACLAFFYAPQPLANRVFWGRWLGTGGDAYHSMDDWTKSFHASILADPARWKELLFNPAGGLMWMTPVLLLSVPCLLLRLRREPFQTAGWLLYPLLLLVGMLALTDDHHGHFWMLYRYLGNAAPMLALGLAEALSRAGGRRAPAFRASAALGALATLWMTLQCQQVEYLRPQHQPRMLARLASETPRLLATRGLDALCRPGSLAQVFVAAPAPMKGASRALFLAAVLGVLAWMAASLPLLERLRAKDGLLKALLGASALALVPLIALEIRQPRRSQAEVYQAALLRLRLSLEDRWGPQHDEALLAEVKRRGALLGEDPGKLLSTEGFILFRRGRGPEAERLWREALARGEDRLALAGLMKTAELRGDLQARDGYARRFAAAPP